MGKALLLFPSPDELTHSRISTRRRKEFPQEFLQVGEVVRVILILRRERSELKSTVAIPLPLTTTPASNANTKSKSNILEKEDHYQHQHQSPSADLFLSSPAPAPVAIPSPDRTSTVPFPPEHWLRSDHHLRTCCSPVKKGSRRDTVTNNKSESPAAASSTSTPTCTTRLKIKRSRPLSSHSPTSFPVSNSTRYEL